MQTKSLIFLLAFLACARREAALDTTQATAGRRDTVAPDQNALFVDRGACPFECCTYGTWRADSAVQLRASPDSSAAVVANVAAGTTVTATTGEVHVKPGVFVMTRGERAYSLDRSAPPTPGDSFKVGDTLLVYTPRGEGAFKVRLASSNGPMFELMLADSSTGCAGANACNGRLLSRPVSTWWANIRTPDGTSGWTTDTRHFVGRDRCGRPLPTSTRGS